MRGLGARVPKTQQKPIAVASSGAKVKPGTLTFAATCYVVAKSSGKPLRGSAILIDPHFALSAAHNLFNRAHFGGDGYATSAEITPGFAYPKASLGPRRISTTFRCHDVFTREGKLAFDIALIYCPEPFTNTKVFATLEDATTAAHVGSAVRIAGYPKPSASDLGMYQLKTMIENHQDGRLYYQAATRPGQSGGPVFASGDDALRVVGVHTYGEDETPKKFLPAVSATALRPALLTWINERKAELAS
jgi:V8-like Glu-specific endopeptidase